MRQRTKWIVAGGAAAFVLTPITAVYGSTALDADLQQSGVVIDAEAANRARAARTTTEAAQAQPTRSVDPTAKPTAKPEPEATKKAASKKPSAKASLEPAGKKTVSAATPVTPNTPVSPVTPE